MRIEVDGTRTTSRKLRAMHDRLSADQQKWIFAQLLDDMYVIQRLWWARKFGGRHDKRPHSGNPSRYMFQTGQMVAGATSPNAGSSYNQVTSKFALLSLRGSRSRIAGYHRALGREVIATPSRRDQRNLAEQMGRYIFAESGNR